MSSVRPLMLLVSAALVVAGCGDEDGGTSSASSSSTTSTVAADAAVPSVPVPAPGQGSDGVGEELDGVVLARALVQGDDLPGFEERSVARPYRAADRDGLLICAEDLRTETGLVEGVQSVLADDAVQVTVTVSAAADSEAATRFLERFAEIADGCAGPWTQEASLVGLGTLEAEVVEPADVGEPGPRVRAYRLRTRTEAGTSEVIAAVLAAGPLVVTVTVAGPEGDDLVIATEAVTAAARRSLELVTELG